MIQTKRVKNQYKVKVLLIDFNKRSAGTLTLKNDQLMKIKSDEFPIQVYPILEKDDPKYLNLLLSDIRFILENCSDDIHRTATQCRLKKEFDELFSDYLDTIQLESKPVKAHEFYEHTGFSDESDDCDKDKSTSFIVDLCHWIYSDTTDEELEQLTAEVDYLAINAGFRVIGTREFLIDLRSICFENEYCV
tara:strand:- start:6232 stop:6804 length:573 start_codon:yes stop_codon:yes gene_type:complete